MLTPQVTPFDPLEYLLEVLPAQLRMGNVPPPSESVLQFIVTDSPSGEVWYRVRNDFIEVNIGLHERPALTLVFTTADLEALTQDTLIVDEALASGRMKVYGRTEFLGWLAARLRPAVTGTH